MLFRTVRAARRRPQPCLKKSAFRPELELLETRWLPSGITVGLLNDTSGGAGISSDATIRGWISDPGYSIAEKEVVIEPTSMYPEVWVTDANGYFEVGPNTTPSVGSHTVHVAFYDHAEAYIEASFSFTYDGDAPSVGLVAPTASDNGTIWLTGSAYDYALATSTTAYLDTSPNNSTWTQYATITLTGNGTTASAGFEVSPALSTGTTYLRLRAADRAGTMGISASQTVVVTSNPSNYVAAAQFRSEDPGQATRVPFGTVSVTPQSGSLRLDHELDFDQSPGTAVGLAPALVYHSDSVNIKSILEGTLAVTSTDWRQLTISVQLTFNGTPQDWVTYGTFWIGPGSNFTALVAAQVASPMTSTGVYPWKLRIRANPYYAAWDNPLIERLVTGTLPVVVRDQSNPFGPGWSLSGLDQLVPYSGSILWVYGSGGSHVFTSAGGGAFTSPANDFGSLVQNGDNSYTYTAKDQSKVHFTSAGLLSRRVDTHNVAVTYTHDGSSRLIGVATPDGGLTTLTYSSNLLATIVEPGPRTITLTHDATRSDLTVIQDADGSLRTLTYDTQAGALHRLRSDAWDPLRATFTYDSKGAVTGLDRGLDTTLQVNPAVYRGLLVGSNPPVWTNEQGRAVLTDALSQLTTYTLDVQGRQTQVQTPDGATQAWQRNAAGQVTVYTDGLNRVTTNTYASGSGKGDLIEVQYPDGSRHTFTYDSTFHQLTQFQDSLNRLSTFTLDAQTGAVLTIRDALNQVTTQTWSGGLKTSVTNPRGYTTSYIYDTARRLQATVDALGGRTTVVYDSNGNVRTTQDALQRTTTTILDSLNRLIQQVDAAGGVHTWTYLASGPVAAQTDARGVETQYTYDQVGGVTRVIQAAGTASAVTTSYTHDDLVLLTSETDGMNHTVTVTHDPMGRLKTRTSAVQAVDTLTYDLAGQRVRAEDPLGHTTSFTYNVRGWRTEVRNPLGEVSTTVYDTEGNVVASVDPRGNRTTTIYDNLNGPVQAVDAAGGLSTIVYDAAGNPVAAIDPRGNRTTTVYDSLNRPLARTDPLGHTVTTVYDAVGNKVRTIDSLGNATTVIYDVLNRVVRVEDAGGGVVTTVYDANGNVVRTIDALAQTTTHIYDLLNRRTQTIDPRGGIVTMVYDVAGNVVSIVDPVGNRTTQIHDADNRLIETIDPTGHSTSYSYDLAGRQTAVTDRLGRVRELVYDDADRLIREIWKSSAGGSTLNTLTYTYDAAGNRLTAADQNGAFTMTYDVLNRVTRVQAPFAVSLTYSYDAASNRTRVEDSFGAAETSTYDAANRLTNREVANSGQAAIRIDLSYNARNDLTGLARQQGPAPIQQIGTSAMSYDSVGRLTHLQHLDGSSSNLANYTYTYDVASRLLTEKLNGTTVTYTYDSTNQLTGDGTNSYSYDLNGNRTMSGYQTGTGNRVTSDGTWAYTYDYEGNLVKKSQGAQAETWTFEYDHRNHMVTAVKRATDGGTVQMRATYTYDVLGRRIEKAVDPDGAGAQGTTTSRFAYDGQEVWADLNGSNALQTRYLHGDVVDQLFARLSANGTAAWYLTDRQGSVRDMTDASGAVLDHLAYDGFGNVLSESNASFGDRYKYTGRELDTETGLLFYRARYYDAKTGRWTSEDPLSFGAGDNNLYRYVFNSSTNATDPSGEKYSATVNEKARVIQVSLGISYFGASANMGLLSEWTKSIIKEWSGEGQDSLGRTWYVQVAVASEIVAAPNLATFNNIVAVLPKNADGSVPESHTFMPPGFFTQGGEWAADADPWVPAHEVGHLFGFNDYYDLASGVPFPGYEGTIMGEFGGSASKRGPRGWSFREKLIDDILGAYIKPDPDLHLGKRGRDAGAPFPLNGMGSGHNDGLLPLVGMHFDNDLHLLPPVGMSLSNSADLLPPVAMGLGNIVDLVPFAH